MIKGKFNLLVDQAHGSSGKGAASTRLADIHDVEHLSSCNYPNAGHTAILGEVKFTAKCLPTGAILHKELEMPVELWIGPGSGFEPDQLIKEAKQTGYYDDNLLSHLVHIHGRAVVVGQRHKDAEAPGGSCSTEHISSTMSGSGAAYTEKAMRLPNVRLARDEFPVMEPVEFIRAIRRAMAKGDTFLHEISQGYALSVNHGTHYPHCTFRDCTPQQAAADFMLLPKHIGDVYLNVRSYPIRVGNNYREGIQTGYSGDCLQDQKELTWAEVGADAEMPEDEIKSLTTKELTTVTKKLRRVFTQSWELLHQSAVICGATKLILNFPQYIHWSSHKLRGGREMLPKLHKKVRDYLNRMEDITNLPVVMIGTGADHYDYIRLD